MMCKQAMCSAIAFSFPTQSNTLALMAVLCGIMVTGCAHQKNIKDPLEERLQAAERAIEKTIPSVLTATQENIPAPTLIAPVLSPPQLTEQPATYTVIVNDVPTKELLFAVARDANVNIEIDPAITGTVTLNAVNQTLAQILDRIANQNNLRYQINNRNVSIVVDTPFLKSYKIDYVNMGRDSSSTVSVATEIATAGGSVTKGASDSGNKSVTTVTNTSNNRFWETLIANIKNILGEGSTSDAGGSAAVIANPISGIINVRANSRQHLSIQSFIDEVMANAQRQVLIEATIAEVELSENFQMGVDWQRLSDAGGSGSNGPSIISSLIGNNLTTAPLFALSYNRDTPGGANLSATIKMLESFGKVRVLSSPKIMALNNQTALLKVVDEKVYFTVEMQYQAATTTSAPQTTFTSTIHTVPIGMVMSVTPQITAQGTITLNIRPTLTRITGFVADPAPKLWAASGQGGVNFDNLIPEIQVREMESLLQIPSGQTIVLGGLMQNKIVKNNSGVPVLSKLPFIGNAFKYRDDLITKTELVIFLRPVTVSNVAVVSLVSSPSLRPTNNASGMSAP